MESPLRSQCLPILLCVALAAPILCQPPNTAAMIVAVTDQSGAAVRDARISVTNRATGAIRETVSGGDGSVTIAALSLTGSYVVNVSKAGFASEVIQDVALR